MMLIRMRRKLLTVVQMLLDVFGLFAFLCIISGFGSFFVNVSGKTRIT